MGLSFFIPVCGSAHLIAVSLPNLLRADWDVHTLGRWKLVSHRHVESVQGVFPPWGLAIFVLFWAIWCLPKPVFGLRLVFSFSRCNPVLTLCFITGLGRLGDPSVGWAPRGCGDTRLHALFLPLQRGCDDLFFFFLSFFWSNVFCFIRNNQFLLRIQCTYS